MVPTPPLSCFMPHFDIVGTWMKNIIEVIHPTAGDNKIAMIKEEAIQQGNLLLKEIDATILKIAKLDQFIEENPDLKQMHDRYLREDRELLQLAEPVPIELEVKDPNDPLDRLECITAQAIRVQYVWKVKIRFIVSHPDLRDAIIKKRSYSSSSMKLLDSPEV